MSDDAAFERALRFTLMNEGGLLEADAAHDQGDPGGETYRGITQATLDRLGIDRSPSDLSDDEIRAIYREHYWRPVAGLGDLLEGLRFAAFDAAVQHGPENAVRLAQGAVGAARDGVLGAKTREAARLWIAAHGGLRLLLRFHAARRQLVTRWASRDPRRAANLPGLVARIDRALERSLLG